MNSKGDAKEDATTTFRPKNHDNLQPKRSLITQKNTQKQTEDLHATNMFAVHQKLKNGKEHMNKIFPPRRSQEGKKESWTHLQKMIYFWRNKCYRVRAPRKHMQKSNLYRMDCAGLSLFFFWKIDSPHLAECNLRAPFCTCGVDAWLGIALNFGAPHVSLPKNTLQTHSSVLILWTLDVSWCSWKFIFCRSHKGHVCWEPDSVAISSGPPRCN